MWNEAKRIVVKVGSSLIFDDESFSVRESWLKTLAQDLLELKSQGKEILLVSSGAVALGRGDLGLPEGTTLKLSEKQAAAACGQTDLILMYQNIFAEHEVNVAQILLTLDDSEDRRRYLNVRNTLETLLGSDVIPIINENDSVTTKEIRVGDNDRLAARVAQMISADILILLSDIDGLYTDNPQVNKDAEHINVVEEITDKISNMAGGTGTVGGSGGMVTKIAAAKIATSFGCHTLIASGIDRNPIKAVLSGKKHTHFTSDKNPQSARKEWIKSSLNVLGKLIVDDGAVKALKFGNSLLPIGVIKVQGSFIRGDVVEICTKSGEAIGRGMVAYNKDDAEKIIGKSSNNITELLGYSGRDELLHRDDMVLDI